MSDHNNTLRNRYHTGFPTGADGHSSGLHRTQTNFESSALDRTTPPDSTGVTSAVNRVLGVDELAAFFGCSTEKIKRRARNRELPAFKFGKSWYVREQDLERYIEQAVELNSCRDQKMR